MPRRSPTPERKSRSGPNIPEAARGTAALKLRVSERVRDILRDQADEQGLPASRLVEELVERTWGRLYETDEARR